MSLSVAFPSQKGYQEAVKQRADDLMFAAGSMVHTSRNLEKPTSVIYSGCMVGLDYAPVKIENIILIKAESTR